MSRAQVYIHLRIIGCIYGHFRASNWHGLCSHLVLNICIMCIYSGVYIHFGFLNDINVLAVRLTI